jgi:hypothetical protein
VALSWEPGDPSSIGGYRIYYDQSGKLQLVAEVDANTLTYKDNRLTSRVSYSYVVTAWSDCDGNGSFDLGTDQESAVSNTATATAR